MGEGVVEEGQTLGGAQEEVLGDVRLQDEVLAVVLVAEALLLAGLAEVDLDDLGLQLLEALVQLLRRAGQRLDALFQDNPLRRVKGLDGLGVDALDLVGGRLQAGRLVLVAVDDADLYFRRVFPVADEQSFQHAGPVGGSTGLEDHDVILPIVGAPAGRQDEEEQRGRQSGAG